MRKVLLIFSAVVLATLVAIPAATFLQIVGPTDLSLTVEAYGDGGSPTLNIIDNTTDTAGGNAGWMDDFDRYMIDFGDEEAVQIIPSQNQRVQVGSCSDNIFNLMNNYDRDMTIRLWVSEETDPGLDIEFWLCETWDSCATCPTPDITWGIQIFRIDDDMADYTLHGGTVDEQVGFEADVCITPDTYDYPWMEPNRVWCIYIVIKTDGSADLDDFTYEPVIKIVGESI